MSDCEGDWSTVIFTNSTDNYNYKPRRTRAEKLADERIKREHKARKLEAHVWEKALKKAEYERTKPPTLKSEKTPKKPKSERYWISDSIAIIDKHEKSTTKRGCVVS